jgi:hypothetical protein
MPDRVVNLAFEDGEILRVRVTDEMFIPLVRKALGKGRGTLRRSRQTRSPGDRVRSEEYRTRPWDRVRQAGLRGDRGAWSDEGACSGAGGFDYARGI